MELLATVGALGFLLTTAVVLIAPLLSDVRKIKLESSVTSLNQALDSFTASGGDLSTVTSAADAIAKLKSTASDKEVIAGYKGSYVDPRLEAVMQDTTEAAGTDWRALWVNADKRFAISQTGSNGIREFRMNDALVGTNFGQDSREVVNKLAKEDNWIWDFHETASTPSVAPDQAVVSDSPEYSGSSNPDALNQLMPPDFSPPGSYFDYFDFPSQVSLANPNDPATTEIHYSLNGGSWQVYSGPIAVARGDQISAFSKLITPAPDVYNSFTTTELYRSQDPNLSGSASGEFKNVVGASSLVSSIGAGQSNATFNYGQAFAGGLQNQLSFTGQSFSNIEPEQTFTIGQLTYLNSTTGVGTSAYEVTLQMDLNFSSPAGMSESVDVTLGLESTKNYPWLTADQQADFVRFNEINTDFTTFFGGETYYLNLEFVYSGSDGYSAVDSFHVHEGATATADVIGYFSPTPREAPDTSGGTSGTTTPATPSLP